MDVKKINMQLGCKDTRTGKIMEETTERAQKTEQNTEQNTGQKTEQKLEPEQVYAGKSGGANEGKPGKEAELLQEKLKEARKVLIGIGPEWKGTGSLLEERNRRLREAYEGLYRLVKDKDYFVVTTLTDGAIYETSFDRERIVAPCGNIHWRQCREACTNDIWEEGEIGNICPHCGGPLIENTVKAEHYLEEGYLPMWKKYQLWLSCTLNRDLAVLELGEGFQTPTVIRWPFEKTVFFNRKAWMFRVNREFYQVTAEIKERCTPVAEDSAEWIIRASNF